MLDGPDNTPAAGALRPRLVVSMGDPLGIGPEIIVKALADADLCARAGFRIHGSARALALAAQRAGIAPFWRSVPIAEDGGPASAHEVLVIDDEDAPAEPGEAGLSAPGPGAGAGAASHRWVEAAVADARRDAIDPRHADAIVTAPIAKTGWTLAGYTEHPGHTELLAERFGAPRHAMLFVGPSLRVILVTIHVPLARVSGLITTRAVLDAVELAAESCREMGIERPRIAVCGLNPHAGEGGILGDQDERVIRPAVEQAGGSGLDATGPWPADAVFLAAAAPPHGPGRYDCVVAMYHDQGLIPVKLLDKDEAVNVTVGLPTVRTSPAHGTAFDIAGRNLARAGSMRAAIELAVAMAQRRRERAEIGDRGLCNAGSAARRARGTT